MIKMNAPAPCTDHTYDTGLVPQNLGTLPPRGDLWGVEETSPAELLTVPCFYATAPVYRRILPSAH
jgi:hypothetical protein